MNEPINIPNWSYWQDTIDAIRDMGLNNKILLGGPQGVDNNPTWGKFTSGNTQDTNNGGFTDSSSLPFPTDSSVNNLAFTLHQYWDENGTGIDYTNYIPTNTVQNIYDSSLLESCINFYYMHRGNTNTTIDFILGETGIGSPSASGTDANFQVGLTNLNYVLSDNFLADTNYLLPPGDWGNVNSRTPTDTNSYILGYMQWSVPGSPNLDEHYYGDIMLNCVVSNITQVNTTEIPASWLWTQTTSTPSSSGEEFDLATVDSSASLTDNNGNNYTLYDTSATYKIGYFGTEWQIDDNTLGQTGNNDVWDIPTTSGPLTEPDTSTSYHLDFTQAAEWKWTVFSGSYPSDTQIDLGINSILLYDSSGQSQGVITGNYEVKCYNNGDIDDVVNVDYNPNGVVNGNSAFNISLLDSTGSGSLEQPTDSSEYFYVDLGSFSSNLQLKLSQLSDSSAQSFTLTYNPYTCPPPYTP